VKIAGATTLPTDPEHAYALLQDPEVLAKCLPGADQLARIGPDEYEMKMKMVVSSISGLFAGKVKIADQDPPRGFRLHVDGSGKVGFMNGSGLLTLAARNGATEVVYDGEVRVGGMIAGVGQRLLETTAKFIIRKFFEKMSDQIRPAGSAGAP
jgi:uncharacterized protein